MYLLLNKCIKYILLMTLTDQLIRFGQIYLPVLQPQSSLY